jgi:hypothetical protein
LTTRVFVKSIEAIHSPRISSFSKVGALYSEAGPVGRSGLSATEESGELEWATGPINGINSCKSSETPDKAQLKLMTLKSLTKLLATVRRMSTYFFLARRPTTIWVTGGEIIVSSSSDRQPPRDEPSLL